MSLRLKTIRVGGLRSIADVKIPLGGLKVLAGPNGVGKSTLIEACQILRKTTAPGFVERLNEAHGGAPALLGHRTDSFAVGARLADEHGEYDYLLKVEKTQAGLSVAHENLFAVGASPEQPVVLFNRFEAEAKVSGISGPFTISVERSATLLSAAGPGTALDPRASAVREVLARIDVHLPFDVRPLWARGARRETAQGGPRDTNLFTPARALERNAANLANAYYELQKRADWQETLEYVRLGLGDEVVRVFTEADPGGGYHALWVEHRHHGQVPASVLSDGQLAYLSFVALWRLNQGKSLIAFDEPDLHLHPALMIRVVGLFETLSEHVPVLLATQSDRLLDCLSRPAESVLVCESDEQSALTLHRLDPTALARWLERFRGVGSLRAEGHLGSVLGPPLETGAEGK